MASSKFSYAFALATLLTTVAAAVAVVVVMNTEPQSREQNSSHLLKRKLIVTTIGNHTFAQLNVSGTPQEYRMLILKKLAEFEQNNTDLEITNWKIEKRPQAKFDPFIYGLWFDHRPRETSSSR